MTAALAVLAGGFAQAALATQATPAQADGAWFVQGAGLSHHFQQTQASGREWQQSHPGVGLEQRVRLGGSADWDRRSAFGLMQDSRGVWSAYAGAAWMRRWQWRQHAEAGLGLGVYAFYKSRNWRGDRTLVPAVMPTASLGLMDNRVGINVLYAPRIAALKDTMPAVLYLQFTVRTDVLK